MNDDMDRSWTRITRELDENLADAREQYLLLNNEERKRFREWVDRLQAMEEPEGIFLYVSARVQFLLEEGGEGGCRAVLVSAKSLHRAVAAWDQGMEYVPDFGDA